jgi:hypothetical protein
MRSRRSFTIGWNQRTIGGAVVLTRLERSQNSFGGDAGPQFEPGLSSFRVHAESRWAANCVQLDPQGVGGFPRNRDVIVATLFHNGRGVRKQWSRAHMGSGTILPPSKSRIGTESDLGRMSLRGLEYCFHSLVLTDMQHACRCWTDSSQDISRIGDGHLVVAFLPRGADFDLANMVGFAEGRRPVLPQAAVDVHVDLHQIASRR